MGDKDIAVSPIGIPVVGGVSKKPAYLILLSNGKSMEKFITSDKPEYGTSCITVKGIYSSVSEDKITQTYADLLSSSPKEEFVEVTFPWHRIHSIRSLVFRAK